jgi:6-phosphogluconate dehydrogenase (decarboxylating)
VIRSWLIDLLAEAYKADPRLEQPPLMLRIPAR